MTANAHRRLKRIASAQRKRLLDYWELGRLAAQEMKKHAISKSQLANDLGIEVATLRIAIKGAACLPKADVRRMQSLGVAWRGMMAIIGCADRHDFGAIVERVITEGIQNSTEIRDLIANDYGKSRHPRISAQVGDSCRKVQKASVQLERLLQAVTAQFAAPNHRPARSATKRLRADLQRLVAAIQDLQEVIA